MNIKATCGFCKAEWMDEIPDRPNYEYGFSICEKCMEERKLENILDRSTRCFNKLDDPHSLQLWSDLTRRDADRLRGCPCNFCNKPSISRLRSYNMEGDLKEVHVIAACEDHLKELKTIAQMLEDTTS